MQSQNRANVCGLRDFLISTECSQYTRGMPLGTLIRECYREFLRQAHADPSRRLPPTLVQERLRQIANDFLSSHSSTRG
jgi:hypothetical protein